MTPPRKSLVIDADGHILEPGSMWTDYIGPKYRDRAPRIETLPEGREVWAGEGSSVQKGDALALSGLGGRSRWVDATKPENRLKMNYSNAHPGSFDPHERLKVHGEEGIDVAILYPTWGLAVTKDPDYAAALHRAYNTWLADFCSVAPGRLIGVGGVPFQDVDLAIAEMRRCARDLGFPAVFLRPNQYVPGRQFYDSHFDRFWAKAQDLDCAIGLHPLRSDTALPGASVGFGLADPSDGRMRPARWLSHTIDSMVALADFVASGIFDRFPRLRTVTLESGGGWLPSVLEKLDQYFEIVGQWQWPEAKTRPSELFKQNCYISVDPDDEFVEFTAQAVGMDRVVWASDFPHPDACFPGAVAEIRKNVASLPKAAQGQILGENAANLYRL